MAADGRIDNFQGWTSFFIAWGFLIFFFFFFEKI